MKTETSTPQQPVLTVSQVTRDVRVTLEHAFSSLWVEGEVSNLRRPASGHVYFTLKDEKSQLPCVMFRPMTTRIKFDLKDGQKVLTSGKISVYERSGAYQLYINTIEPRGIGALQLAFKQLQEKLLKQGLFADEHKKPLPVLPQRIGVVTSSTGAAIRDILNVLNRRFSNLEVLIYPVRVQGDEAAGEIAHAIDVFHKHHNVDVIIVGRGGGSIEDLWAFNEEIVARAIFECALPVISAVGHEIDWTIADYVADLRAPTPSAAAELVIASKEELMTRIQYCLRQLAAYPAYRLKQAQQKTDELIRALENSMLNHLRRGEHCLTHCVGRLSALSPLGVLGRGYSLTTYASTGKVIRDAAQLKPGDRLHTRFMNGECYSRVDGKVPKDLFDAHEEL